MSDRSSRSLAERFRLLYAGLDRVYGTYNVTATREEDGKRVGNGRDISTVQGKVTEELWEAHLAGRQRLGIVPIRDGNDCTFGAIDIDQYQGMDHRSMVQKLARLNIPLAVCRSKSGGAHLYCFTLNPVPATMMRTKLLEVASFLGYGGAEVFPKQTQLLTEKGDCGQWINMPYFGGLRGMCYCTGVDGNAMTQEQFLDYAAEICVDDEWFSQLLVIGSEFADGPPCLQTLAQVGIPAGMRNDGLFDVGVYLKKSFPDTWENELVDYNNKLFDPPLTAAEVQGVAKSLKRKEYSYACNKQPIAQHCNATMCRTRKYGIGSSGAGKFPMLGGLTKLNTMPPIWFWSVDGARIEFTTTELQSPVEFQRKCMEHLNTMPQIPAKPAWQAAVELALKTVTVIEAPKDSSVEGQFWEISEKFFNGRAQGMVMEEILMGKPYSSGGRTYFRMVDLLKYLQNSKFFDFKAPKISSLIQDAGGEHHFSVLKGRGTNYWSILSIAKQDEAFNLPNTLADTGEVF